MSITLPLSRKDRAALELQAAAAGQDLQTFLLAVLLRAIDSEQDDSTAADCPFEQWQRDFDSWIAGHQSRNPNFDDSRESIYD